MRKKDIVAIVGRPNVGKSTLFNRIIKKRLAIVHGTPGVTRDRHYAETEWAGHEFVLVDTGGYFSGSSDVMDKAILQQINGVIDEATLIIFVVDGQSGVISVDEEIARMLRQSNKPSVLTVNKIDDPKHLPQIVDFYKLGGWEPLSVSASNGRQIGDLLDEVIAKLPEGTKILPSKDENEERNPNDIRLAIVGRPNAGKSSLVNAFLGHDKLIVTDIPGTTRDSIDTNINYKENKFVLIDTAGLRKIGRVKEAIEFYSTVRTRDAIKRCDITALIIDAEQEVTDQDLHILSEVAQLRKGIILVINKWDLIEKDAETADIFQDEIMRRLRIFNYVPVIFISAKTKKRVFKLLDVVMDVHKERQRQLRTSDLNRFLQKAIAKFPPPSMDRREVKINYCAQVKNTPPVFAFFCNHPDSIPANYRQYLEKLFRRQFGFTGIPLSLKFRKK